MLRYFILLLVFIIFYDAKAQDLTATQLLDKSIEYHDPNDLWDIFQGKLFITMSYPDGRERLSVVEIDLPKESFKLTTTTKDDVIEQSLSNGDCTLRLNGNTDISEEDKKEHRISCERVHVMKNYYTYLYGLPMKLKDPGTHLDPTVQTKKFKGKEYLVLKVTYDEDVGKDTWYFYFDPETFAMEVYQFFHDESKNDGEYILLSGIEKAASIKLPKTRAWYFNKDDKHLGTDELTKASHL
ncbi:DUF6503 family protein [Maribacter sp. HTCC2170]|uniref:DUF6503 family protein n=1 Tax=Maribacter sp. (strain HTCC2170 / KCCM 42371) TaxID=313603 RepID=UPI00006BD20D|nr:DUF6503 family protein [Maribacter sp. HTCC2170]EAR02600.1 hypothetical protein FB2170_04915 [Maribacter sp. HTCC2170]